MNDRYTKIVTAKVGKTHIVPENREIPLELTELEERIRLCDENCNECPLLFENPSNRMLTFILNKALEKFGDEFYEFVEWYCPNLTVCVECRVDDFVHVEGCTIHKVLNESHSFEGETS